MTLNENDRNALTSDSSTSASKSVSGRQGAQPRGANLSQEQRVKGGKTSAGMQGRDHQGRFGGANGSEQSQRPANGKTANHNEKLNRSPGGPHEKDELDAADDEDVVHTHGNVQAKPGNPVPRARPASGVRHERGE